MSSVGLCTANQVWIKQGQQIAVGIVVRRCFCVLVQVFDELIIQIMYINFLFWKNISKSISYPLLWAQLWNYTTVDCMSARNWAPPFGELWSSVIDMTESRSREAKVAFALLGSTLFFVVYPRELPLSHPLSSCITLLLHLFLQCVGLLKLPTRSKNFLIVPILFT